MTAASRSCSSWGAVACLRVVVTAHAAGVEGATQEPVHRQAEQLAAEIPERLVDPRDRRADDRPSSVEAVHIHRLPVVLDLDWITTDQEVAEVIHASDDRARLAFEGALTPANDASVGLELHEDIWAIRLGGQRHAEHLHAGDPRPRAEPPECLTAERVQQRFRFGPAATPTGMGIGMGRRGGVCEGPARGYCRRQAAHKLPSSHWARSL